MVEKCFCLSFVFRFFSHTKHQKNMEMFSGKRFLPKMNKCLGHPLFVGGHRMVRITVCCSIK